MAPTVGAAISERLRERFPHNVYTRLSGQPRRFALAVAYSSLHASLLLSVLGTPCRVKERERGVDSGCFFDTGVLSPLANRAKEVVVV